MPEPTRLNWAPTALRHVVQTAEVFVQLRAGVLIRDIGRGYLPGVGVAVWARRQQAQASRDAGYLAGVHAAAAVGATGGSPQELIKTMSTELTGTLGLIGCTYQSGVAGRGKPPRLERDGRITWNRSVSDVERLGLPSDSAIELLVQSGGRLHGRFLLSASPKTHPSLPQRLLAVTLADQVGAALG